MGLPRSEVNPLGDLEERRVLFAALDSFRQYRQAAHYNITHLRRQSFYSLPSPHVDLLSLPPFSLPQTFRAVDDAIDCNADIAEAILSVGLRSFGLDAHDDSWKGKATASDVDKARSTIRQLWRDWSAEGSAERRAAFEPIAHALTTHLRGGTDLSRRNAKVLVPGAGLGRLVFDLCQAGYTVEGNEISYHQLLASNYILNHTFKAGQHTLYPWALNFSNHTSRGRQLQAVPVPDIHPAAEMAKAQPSVGEVHYGERMSMSAGDFCVVYRQPEHENAFSAVATCYFIDTAPNVITYVETIRHCLAPGGVWVNLGPLLWHFESSPTPADRSKDNHPVETGRSGADGNKGIGEPGSFELTDDEMLALLRHYDFEIVERSRVQESGYVQDRKSMLQNVYNPSFWVAKKKPS